MSNPMKQPPQQTPDPPESNNVQLSAEDHTELPPSLPPSLTHTLTPSVFACQSKGRRRSLLMMQQKIDAFEMDTGTTDSHNRQQTSTPLDSGFDAQSSLLAQPNSAISRSLFVARVLTYMPVGDNRLPLSSRICRPPASPRPRLQIHLPITLQFCYHHHSQ